MERPNLHDSPFDHHQKVFVAFGLLEHGTEEEAGKENSTGSNEKGISFGVQVLVVF